MKKKLHIYIIILTIGFFLLPNLNYACGTKIEKECCKKEISTNKVEKECCKNEKSNNKNKRCGGKCGHSNCTSSTTVNFSIISSYEVNFKNNSLDFSWEKAKFHHSKTFVSSGFYFIWLIPKIS